MEKENNCKHNFESRSEEVQERYNKYLSAGSYDNGTLKHTKHYIFCTKCGEIKRIPGLLK